MGGINHQPCKGYLPWSTMMSLNVSASIVELERANVALERVILAELAGTTVASFQDFLDRLADSQTGLGNFKASVFSLKAKMDEEQFEDLPSLRTINLGRLGDLMYQKGLVVSRSAWKRAEIIMKSGGFYGMIDAFIVEAKHLEKLTEDLVAMAGQNRAIAKRGRLAIVLEENGPTNFKVEFARLYSAWAEFHQFFLASSMISTEAWYRQNKLGSLVENHLFVDTAAA